MVGVVADRMHDVLTRLDGAKRSGSGWTAKCPAHDDRSPSLSVSEGDTGGVLVHCHAGCTTEDVVAALGLEMADLAPPSTNGSRSGGLGDEVAAYCYTNEDGEPLFEVVRYFPKTFRQRQPDGTWGIKGVRRVLYRLPDVVEAVEDGRAVFVVEGEKDADRLASLGLTATTCPAGAGKWRQEYTDQLRGARVVITPDNDEPGREHAEHVAGALHGAGCEVRVLELPDLPAKGDVADWLDAGGTVEELKTLAKDTPVWSPPTDTAWVSLADADPEALIHQRTRPVDAIPTPWPSVNAVCRDDGGMQGLAAPWMITLAGPTGAGKSIAAGNIMASGIRHGATVGLISLEMLQRQTYTRFLATVSDTPVVQLERGPKFDPDALRRAVQAVRDIRDETGGEILTSDRRIFGLAGVLDAMRELAARGCRELVIDYLQLSANQNDARTITEASQRIRNLGFELDIVVVAVSQFNRDPFRDGRKPTIHDLSGGSSIENDSDMVWLLDTSERKRAEAPRTGFYLSLNVAKNRHGPGYEAPIYFNTRTLRMVERSPDEMPAHTVGS